MSYKKQSIVGFLDPGRLINTNIKPKKKANLFDSQYYDTKNSNLSDEIKNYPINFNKIDNQIEPSQFKNNQLKDKQQYNYIISKDNLESNPFPNNKSYNPIYKSKQQFDPIPMGKLQYQTKAEQVSKQFENKLNDNSYNDNVPSIAFQMHKVMNEDELKSSNASKNNENAQKMNIELFPSFEPNIKEDNFLKKKMIDKETLLNTMGKLADLKKMIDKQLNELKMVLDDTSKYIQDIDDEYGRIKQRILDYTSQVLDAGFGEYRRNMVDWRKYQEVEKKGDIFKLKLEKVISEDNVIIEEIVKLNKNEKIMENKQEQIEEKIELYQNLLNELKENKLDCLKNRPCLKREKLEEFQKIVQELAVF